ncbi:MAG: calcium/sodium antiporter [Deltaproteobacteria bacterium]|nr:calcium/sodium antiporter [Deltaproteobacteria bacterium]
MLTDLLITLAGLSLLVGGGELMVRGASSLASRFGVSPLAIGLTVVAFGTSTPELFVNVTAALHGNTELSFGNIFGSNMANIGLIIAITALVGPLRIRNVVIDREVPMMMLATLVAAALGLDWVLEDSPGAFTRGDGVVLLLLFSVFAYYTLRDLVRQRSSDVATFEVGPAEEPPRYSMPVSLLLTAAGLAALAAGGSVTVEGAEAVARALGVSQTIIGLTLVAIGTSLPELSASVIASMRGYPDMAVGNVVGSNIFNLLIVLGTTATLADIPVPDGGIADLFVVICLSGLLWLTSISQGRTIIRAEATLLLGLYLGYLVGRTLL